MMQNQYDVTYHLVRRQLLAAIPYGLPADCIDQMVKVLDVRYANRLPFPIEIQLIVGDPLGTRVDLGIEYDERNSVPVRGLSAVTETPMPMNDDPYGANKTIPIRPSDVYWTEQMRIMKSWRWRFRVNILLPIRRTCMEIVDTIRYGWLKP